MSAAPRDPKRLVYQPGVVRLLAGLVWAGLAWWLVSLLLSGDAATVGRRLPMLALVGLAAWALFWRPAVVVDDDALLLRNLVRDIRVPWNALEGIDTRFALVVTADGRRYTSWAAAAPGRPVGIGAAVRRGEMPWVRRDVGAVRSSMDPTSDTGATAFMVESRWERRRGATAGQVHVRWVPAVVVPLVVAAGVTLVVALAT